MNNDTEMNKDIFVVIEHLRGQVADISYVMLAAAGELAQFSGGEVVGVLLAHDGQNLADDLAADRVLYIDDPALAEFSPDAYQTALTGLLQKHSPRALLMGSTTIGADIASVLSVRLDLPLVGLCRRFGSNGSYVSQICGGKIMAEGPLPGPTALITMIPGGYKPDLGRSETAPLIEPVDIAPLGDLRIKLANYIEPEEGDVDMALSLIHI